MFSTRLILEQKVKVRVVVGAHVDTVHRDLGVGPRRRRLQLRHQGVDLVPRRPVREREVDAQRPEVLGDGRANPGCG